MSNYSNVGDNIVYIFVSLNELDTPEYHIVPSKIVADTISREYQIGCIRQEKMDSGEMKRILEISTIRMMFFLIDGSC